jgi:hypothetical protein
MMKLVKQVAIIGTAINFMFVAWIFGVWETPLSFGEMLITMISSGGFWYLAIQIYIIVIGIWLAIFGFPPGSAKDGHSGSGSRNRRFG